MKRLLAVWIMCAAAAIGSFASLVAEDRQLGVPLPYSVPLAFGSMQIVAAALLAIVEHLRAKRPVVVHTVERRRKQLTTRDGRAFTEGSVLLDFSKPAHGGRAA